MKTIFDKRVVLVTGASGTVGRALIRALISEVHNLDIKCTVVGSDHDEAGLFELQQEFSSADDFQVKLADVRDKSAMVRVLDQVDLVFHLAALKHVGLTETAPDEALKTNIQGTSNVIDASILNGVQRVVFASSDKAVNPTSVMGTTKLLGERLITAANFLPGGTLFSCTRFGNVVGSSGSVIPLFKAQILGGGPVTITSEEMSRFIMTKVEAANLLIETCCLMTGGEVFVTKMKAVRIVDLLNVMLKKYQKKGIDIEIECIGARPGEKIYEELVTEDELSRTVEHDNFLVIEPALLSNSSPNQDKATLLQYNSSKNRNTLDEVGIEEMLSNLEKENIEIKRSSWFAFK